MTTAIHLPAATAPLPSLVAEGEFVNAEVFSLTGVTWDAYVALRDSLDANGRPGIRLTYDDGNLDLMSPLHSHDEPKTLLDRAVLVLCEAFGRRCRGVGSPTYRKRKKKKGFEPDQSYYLRPDKLAALPRGRFPKDYDVAAGPVPDLGIEIDVTHSSIPRLPLYAAFGIDEVWRADADAERVTILRRTGDGYAEATSDLFPGLTGTLLTEALTLEAEDDAAWMRAFRNLIGERLGPSLGAGDAG